MKCLSIITVVFVLNTLDYIIAAPQQPPWPLPPNFGQSQPAPTDGSGRPPSNNPFAFLDIFGNIFNSIWTSIPRIVGMFQPQNRPPANQPNNQLPPFPNTIPVSPAKVPYRPSMGPQPAADLSNPSNILAQWPGFQQPIQNQQSTQNTQTVVQNSQGNVRPSTSSQQSVQNSRPQTSNSTPLLTAQFGSNQATQNNQRPAQISINETEDSTQNTANETVTDRLNILSQLAGLNRPNQQTEKSTTSDKNNSSTLSSSTKLPPNKKPEGSELLDPVEDD